MIAKEAGKAARKPFFKTIGAIKNLFRLAQPLLCDHFPLYINRLKHRHKLKLAQYQRRVIYKLNK
ncbi:MAG: hypothetical protein IIA98_02945 [Proteobacteria bacterium]|nr:hypothetical protein [Pseudomonadota bacterium]